MPANQSDSAKNAKSPGSSVPRDERRFRVVTTQRVPDGARRVDISETPFTKAWFLVGRDHLVLSIRASRNWPGFLWGIVLVVCAMVAIAHLYGIPAAMKAGFGVFVASGLVAEIVCNRRLHLCSGRHTGRCIHASSTGEFSVQMDDGGWISIRCWPEERTCDFAMEMDKMFGDRFVVVPDIDQVSVGRDGTVKVL